MPSMKKPRPRATSHPTGNDTVVPPAVAPADPKPAPVIGEDEQGVLRTLERKHSDALDSIRDTLKKVSDDLESHHDSVGASHQMEWTDSMYAAQAKMEAYYFIIVRLRMGRSFEQVKKDVIEEALRKANGLASQSTSGASNTLRRLRSAYLADCARDIFWVSQGIVG